MLGFSNKTLNGTNATPFTLLGNWYEDRLIAKQVHQDFPEKRIVNFVALNLYSADPKKQISAVCLRLASLQRSKLITAAPSKRLKASSPTMDTEN